MRFPISEARFIRIVTRPAWRRRSLIASELAHARRRDLQTDVLAQQPHQEDEAVLLVHLDDVSVLPEAGLVIVGECGHQAWPEFHPHQAQDTCEHRRAAAVHAGDAQHLCALPDAPIGCCHAVCLACVAEPTIAQDARVGQAAVPGYVEKTCEQKENA